MAEITLRDEFGAAIFSTCVTFGVRSVIEVGSWDGTGSTAVFISALSQASEGERRLTCLEANPERHAALVENVKGYPWVEAIRSRSVSRAGMTPTSFDEMWSSPFNGLACRYAKEDVQRWWGETPDGPGYLESLTTETWDAALIDGCEFCGWDDYRLLRDRVRVLMLDDVFSAYKCAQANLDLACRTEWACVWKSIFVRNGAAIWIKPEAIR